MPQPKRAMGRAIEAVAKDCAVHMNREFEGNLQLVMSSTIYLAIRNAMSAGMPIADLVSYIEAMAVGDTDALKRLDAIVIARREGSKG
jgi:hypothetical protein